MCGIEINKTGGTEVLEYKTDMPVPQPGEGQILLKNDYTGVNYIDTYVSRQFQSVKAFYDSIFRAPSCAY